ncbi:MAG: PQQ-binding-like beta-propeller repeat protein [Pirellulales bacterium]
MTAPTTILLRSLCVVFAGLAIAISANAADWTQFRGPGGQGQSEETGIPTKWSGSENMAWRAELPGPGASCPITLGNRVFVTCYSGYGLEPNSGDQKDLLRHLLCIDRAGGQILWHKTIEPKLPEHQYNGEGSYHGYAAATPATDGERLYAFYGRTGVFCYDLDGNQIWQASVGDGTNGWGSGTSPLLYGDLVIINASIESGSLVALNKADGTEIWRAKGINASWNTPIIASANGGKDKELVVSISDHVVGFDPDKGDELWRCEGVHRYVCPSLVAHEETVYCIGGGHTSLAVRTGGRGDVSKSHTVWRQNKGSNVGSPIYHEGHLYWANDSIVCCQDANTGETVYQERLPEAGRVWSSPVLADGKLYLVSQQAGTYVVAAMPKFELLAHNVIEDDASRTNASPAISNGKILLRTDKALYCIGQR